MFPVQTIFINPSDVNGAKAINNEKINKFYSQLSFYSYLRNWVIRKQMFDYMNEIEYLNLLPTHTYLL